MDGIVGRTNVRSIICGHIGMYAGGIGNAFSDKEHYLLLCQIWLDCTNL
jgi:hypothetical protein